MMTDRVKERLAFLKKREYRDLRDQSELDITEEAEPLSPSKRRVLRFTTAVNREIPVFYGEDWFGFNRHAAKLPEEHSTRYFFGNITPDYETVLREGFDSLKARAEASNVPPCEFLTDALTCLNSAYQMIEEYRAMAEKNGLTRLATALRQVPKKGARDYYEALLTLKICHFFFRINRSSHMTFGRFDQYMLPYYEASIRNGATPEEILELTELFFIAMNLDTDLIRGIQRGDNGQSLMVGGCDKDGNDTFNPLSEICLQACEDLRLIDPKINIRVRKDTPLALYERGTRLTKLGLGFPQYSNDDVVIPALVKLGYDLEDARNYTVAACWEFIVPFVSGDIVNRGTFNFPLSVEAATKKALLSSDTFEAFMASVYREMEAQAADIRACCDAFRFVPDPFLSLFIRGLIEKRKDVSENGAKYNNTGVHGAGLANAADALAAIKALVYDRKSVTKETLLAALEADFVGYEDVKKDCIACSKMGNNEDLPDTLAGLLMDCFSKNMNGIPNARGGVFRAGTGSAMDYIKEAKRVGATADGRNAYTPYPSSFSPSLIAKMNGPLSAILSFTKRDLTDICNGGPFTIEIHDTVFSHAEGEKKTAMLIKSFFDRNGHQMQINAVNREELLDAKKNPDDHRGLIVRVWGWSGYFTELDPEYQNHIIARTEFQV